METYSKDLLRGVGGGDDGEEKVQRSESRTEEVDLSLGLSLGGLFGAERRSGEGLAGSSSVASIEEVALAPLAPVRTNTAPTMANAEAGGNTAFLRNGVVVQPSATPQGSGVPLNGVVVETSSALLRATLSAFLGSAGELQPSANLQGIGYPLSSIKEEPVPSQGILTSTSSLPAGIESGLRKRKPKILERLEAKRRIDKMNYFKVMGASQASCLPGKPKSENAALIGTPSAEGRSLSAAVVSWPERPNGVVATASSSASAVIAAALGSGREQQDAPELPATMVREMPLVGTTGLPNGMRAVGWLYEYSKVDKVRIKCVCHGSFFSPAGFVEHAGGGRVANPLRSILVKPPF